MLNAATVLLALWWPGQVQTAAPSATLQQQVDQLVRQLDNPDRAVRDTAEKGLLQLGTDALSHLPSVDDSTPAELRERLAHVRRQLEQAKAAQSVQASRLTLQGRLMLDELLPEIERQTGNRLVDFRGRFGQPADPLRISVDLQDKPFWPALDQILDQSGLSLYTYVGEPRTLGVVQSAPGEQPRAGIACNSGLFRIEPVEVTAVRSLRSSINRGLRLRLEVLWEPRVIPVLIRQNYSDVHVTGDDGAPIEVVVDQGSVEIPVQSTVAGVELAFPLRLPPRSVKKIARVEGRFTALVPGREETFEFPDLANARDVVQQRGGLTVTLDRVRKNGALYEFRVRIRLANAEVAFQSHLDWTANNVVYLIGPTGERLENPNFERYLERSDEIGFAYLFPVSGELSGYRLVYQTPAAMLELPVDYQLQDIELP